MASNLSFRTTLTPIMLLALVVALLAWTGAWVFRDNEIFSTVLLGMGCLPIIIAIVAYLLVLLKKLKSR
jgi:hypothetical protein